MCVGAGSVSASFLSVESGGGGNHGTEGLSKGRREGFGEQMKKKERGREGGRGLDVTLARHSCQRLKRERRSSRVAFGAGVDLPLTHRHTPTRPQTHARLHPHLCGDPVKLLPFERAFSSYLCLLSAVVWRWSWCCTCVCRSSATLCQPRLGEYHLCVIMPSSAFLWLCLFLLPYSLFLAPTTLPLHKSPQCSFILADITFNPPLLTCQPADCHLISSSWAKLDSNAPTVVGAETFPLSEMLCTDMSVEQRTHPPLFTSLEPDDSQQLPFAAFMLPFWVTRRMEISYDVS